MVLLKSINRKLLFLVLIISTSFLFSQKKFKVDSLLKLPPTSNDSLKIIRYGQLSDAYLNEKKIGLAINYLDSALIHSKKCNSLKLEAYSYNSFGNLYNYLNNYSKAIDYFEKATSIYKKINYKIGVITNITNIGISYYYLGNNTKAIKYNRLALTIYNTTSVNDMATLSNIYNNLGSFYGTDENYTEAKVYFTKALELDIKDNDFIGQAYIYNNFGSIESNQGNYNEALIYLEKALALKLKYGDNSDKADGYKEMGNVYYGLKKHEKSITNFNIALNYSDTALHSTDLIAIYKGLAQSYEANKNLALANNYNKLINSINSEIYKKNNEEQITKKELEFQLTQIHLNDSLAQAYKITNQQTQLKRGETVKYFLIIIVIIITLFLVIIYKRFKISQVQKNEISKQKHVIEEKQKEIISSINYAKRIQQSMLPSDKYITKKLKK